MPLLIFIIFEHFTNKQDWCEFWETTWKEDFVITFIAQLMASVLKNKSIDAY